MNYPYTLKTGTLKKVLQKIPKIGIPPKFNISYLKTLGVTRQKSSYIINVANDINNGKLDPKILNKLDDEIVKEKLMRIKGIGSWSADIYLLIHNYHKLHTNNIHNEITPLEIRGF